jgi:uncharacterized protein YodC (DUF2158 family)
MNIERGAIVRLKSGGPNMLVMGMVGALHSGPHRSWLCAWARSEDNPTLSYEVFQEATLDVVLGASTPTIELGS